MIQVVIRAMSNVEGMEEVLWWWRKKMLVLKSRIKEDPLPTRVKLDDRKAPRWLGRICTCSDFNFCIATTTFQHNEPHTIHYHYHDIPTAVMASGASEAKIQ